MWCIFRLTFLLLLLSSCQRPEVERDSTSTGGVREEESWSEALTVPGEPSPAETDTVPESIQGTGLYDLLRPTWQGGEWAFYGGSVEDRRAPQTTNVVLIDGTTFAVWGPGTSATSGVDSGILLGIHVVEEAVNPGQTEDSLALGHGRVLGAVDLDNNGVNDLLMSRSEDFIGLREAGASIEWPEVAHPYLRARELTSWVSWTVADFDLDGMIDVVMTSQDCGDAPVWRFVPYLNDGRGTWAPRVDLVDHGQPGSTSGGIMMAPLGPDMVPTIVTVGEPCTPDQRGTDMFFQPTGRNDDGWITWGPNDLIRESGWVSPRNPTGHPTQQMPMGGFIADINGDRNLDLGISPSGPRMMMFVWDEDVSGFVDESSRSVEFATGPYEGWPKYPWGVYPADIDADGRLDLFITQGNDSLTAFGDTNGAHYNSVWWNTGDRFADISHLLGIGSAHAGRFGDYWNVTAADINGDARPEFGVGGPASPAFEHPDNDYVSFPELMMNGVEAGQPLHIVLQGTTSNHLGAGAKVTVLAGNRVATYAYSGSSGSLHAGATPGIFAGIGDAESATVIIEWPSGTRQEVIGVLAGKRVFVEPETIHVSQRAAFANGADTVTITVTPTVAPAYPVSIEVPWGSADWVAPIVRHTDGRWTRELRAPTEVGWSVIEVTLDGVVQPIHPRVWWE